MDVFSGNLTALKGGPEDKAIDFLFEVKNIKIGDLVNIGEATIKCTKTQLIVVCSTVVALGILGIGYKVFSSSGGSISNNKKLIELYIMIENFEKAHAQLNQALQNHPNEFVLLNLVNKIH